MIDGAPMSFDDFWFWCIHRPAVQRETLVQVTTHPDRALGTACHAWVVEQTEPYCGELQVERMIGGEN